MQKIKIKETVEAVNNKVNNIRDVVLKHVPAKCIYLFGSYAYDAPTEKSDVDIYVVTPDDTTNFSELYTKVEPSRTQALRNHLLSLCAGNQKIFEGLSGVP